MSLAAEAEAEIGAVFINAKEGAVLRTTLEELGNPQAPQYWKHTTPLPHDTEMAQ
jgi:hypothetical protein